MSENETQKVHLSELSTEALFALFYSLAMLSPEAINNKENLTNEQFFRKYESMLKLSGDSKRRALRKGLNDLANVHAISLARNGLGEYEPAELHLEVLSAGSTLVLRDDA